MVIIALADIHGNIKGLESCALDLSTADLILLTGDITNFGRQEDAARIVNAIRKHKDRILAVPGNCDPPEVDAYLTKEGINLHRKTSIINGITFFGIGGSLPCPAQTPNEISEYEFGYSLDKAATNFGSDGPMIFVTHQPPRNTVTDLALNGKHVGSDSIRKFIEGFQPVICFTGHIHEGRGVDSIKGTRILNPGPLRKGGYAYARIAGQVVKAEIRG